MPEPQNIPTAPVGKLSPYQQMGGEGVPTAPVGKLVPHEDIPTAPVGKLSPNTIETPDQAKQAGFQVHPGIGIPGEGRGVYMMAPPPGFSPNQPTGARSVGETIPDWAVSPMAGFQQHVNKPLEDLAKVGVGAVGTFAKRQFEPYAHDKLKRAQWEQVPYHQAELGIAQGVGGAVGGMVADPRNWPFFASSMARPILQQLISGGFGIQMGAGALQGAQQLSDNWDHMTPQQRSELATQTGLNAIFASLAAIHGLGGGEQPEATRMSDANRQATPAAATPSQPVAPDIERLKTLGGLRTQGGQMGVEGGPGPITRPGQTAAGQRGTGALSGGQRAETTAIAPQEPTVGTVTPKPATTQAGGETPLDQALRLRGAQAVETPAERAVREHRESPQGKAEETSRLMLQQAAKPPISFERAEDKAKIGQRPTEAVSQGASQEAINRQRAERQKDIRIMSTDTRSGQSRQLIGPEAHAGDVKPGPYDRIERVYPDGRRELIQEGKNARPVTPKAPTAQPTAQPGTKPVQAPQSQAAPRPAGEPIRPQSTEPVRQSGGIEPQQAPRPLKPLAGRNTEPVEPRKPAEAIPPAGPSPEAAKTTPIAKSELPLREQIRLKEAQASIPEVRPLDEPFSWQAVKEDLGKEWKGLKQEFQKETPGTQALGRYLQGKASYKDIIDLHRLGVTDEELEAERQKFEAKPTARGKFPLAEKKPGEAGFASFGGKKPASKKAAQTEALHEAIKQDKPHKIIEKLDSFVRSLPESTVDQRMKDADAAIQSQPTTQPGKIRQAAANLTANVKVIGDWYKNGEKAGIKLRDALKGNTDPKVGFKQALGKYNEAENVGAADAHAVIEDIRAVHPEHVIKAMHVGMDVGFDKDILEKAANNKALPEDLRKAAYIAQRLTPEERTAAEHYDSFFKETGDLLSKTGGLRHMLENYVPHMVDVDSKAGQQFMAELRAGVFDTNFKYARQRIHETMFDGAEKGVKYQLGVDRAIWDYHRRAVQSMGSRAFIKELSDVVQKDNRPALVPGYNTISPILPSDYSKYPAIKEILDASPKLRAELADAYMFKDNRGAKGPIMDAGMMDALGIDYDQNTLTENDKARMDVSDYKHVEHPSFKQTVYVGKGKGGKPVFYKADLYAHPAIYDDLKNIYEGSQFRTSKIGQGLLKLTSISKKALLKVLPSGFHYTQEGWHAVGHGVNPFKPELWSGETARGAVNDTVVRKGLRAGLQLYEYDYADAMEGIKGVRGFEKDFNNHLFGKFIPGLKIETFKKQVAENLKIYRPKGYSEQRIYEMTAQQINNAYGMQNRLFTGRTKFMQDLFRLTALAPDFLESRARFIGGAARPGGHRQRVALMRQFLYMYGTARVLNSLTNDGDAKWGVKDMFTWHFKGHEFSIRSVLTDAMFAATAPSDFLISRGALFPKAAYEAGKEAGKPTFLKDKLKGGVAEGLIRNTVPIMLQRPTLALYRKFYEEKYGKSVAWEAFAGMLEAALGIREREEATPKKSSSGLPGLSKLPGVKSVR